MKLLPDIELSNYLFILMTNICGMSSQVTKNMYNYYYYYYYYYYYAIFVIWSTQEFLIYPDLLLLWCTCNYSNMM